MLRRRPRANRWLCFLSSLALLGSVFTSPVRPQVPRPHTKPHCLQRNFALACDESRSRLAFSATTPSLTSTDSDRSDYCEEDEDESFWAFSHLVCPTSPSSGLSRRFLSDARPGHSPPRTAAVPLRC
jgi:hypothetical protein